MKQRSVATNQIPVACFAPPLTDELLAQYKIAVAACADLEVKDALVTCLKCVEKWWAVEESTAKPITWNILRQGQPATFNEIPLTDALIQELWETTPWLSELVRLSNAEGTGLFDKLPAGGFRNMAFHILWHTIEISNDREPITQDKI